MRSSARTEAIAERQVQTEASRLGGSNGLDEPTIGRYVSFVTTGLPASSEGWPREGRYAISDDSIQALSLVEQRLREAGCNVGSDVVLRSDRRGISMFGPDGQPVARMRNLGKVGWEVLWWSHRDKWESIGDLGGIVCDDMDEALTYVLEDPMGIFW